VVAERYAALAREEAAHLNRDGDYRSAARILERVARKIQGYAGDDVVLIELAEQLLLDSDRYSEVMPAMERKQAFFVSHNLSRGGDVYSSRKRWK